MPIAWMLHRTQQQASIPAGSTRWSAPQRLRDCLIALLVTGLLLVTAGCGPGAGAPPRSDYGVWLVYFAPAVSYEDALGLVTDIGLQLGRECGYATLAPTNETQAVQWAPWMALSQRQDYAYHLGQSVSPFLVVQPTVLAPGDWSGRLLKEASVQSVKGIQGNVACTGIRYSETPPAGDVNDLLRPDQTGTYAQISFHQPHTPSYGAALDGVLNLGLRLADPCYERAIAQGQSPAWHPMGQKEAFAGSHTLNVATTWLTGNLWQEQARALPATVTIATDAADQCGHP